MRRDYTGGTRRKIAEADKDSGKSNPAFFSVSVACGQRFLLFGSPLTITVSMVSYASTLASGFRPEAKGAHACPFPQFPDPCLTQMRVHSRS